MWACLGLGPPSSNYPFTLSFLLVLAGGGEVPSFFFFFLLGGGEGSPQKKSGTNFFQAHLSWRTDPFPCPPPGSKPALRAGLHGGFQLRGLRDAHPARLQGRASGGWGGGGGWGWGGGVGAWRPGPCLGLQNAWRRKKPKVSGLKKNGLPLLAQTDVAKQKFW